MDFIVIMIVMAALIFFVGAVITRLSQQVGKQIDKDVNVLINTYDVLLEEKSQELDRLSKEIEMAKQSKDEMKYSYDGDDYSDELLCNTIIVQAGNYVDQSFFEKYNLIRNEFRDLSYEAMKTVALKLALNRRNINVHEYKELLHIFDFNLQYQMDTLDSEGQLMIMREIINSSVGKKKVVERYLKEYGTFSFESFIDYLRSYIFFNDNVVYVTSRDGIPVIEDSPKNIVYKKDSTIGEGFVVSYRDQYHDFSLKGGLYE